MRRGAVGALGLVALVCTTACSPTEFLERQELSPEGREGRAVIDALARGALDAVTEHLDVALRSPDLRARLEQMAAFFPKAQPTRVRLIGFFDNTMHLDGDVTETTQITFELNYPASHVVAQVVLRRKGGDAATVIGLHANPLPAPLEVINAFTFAGKGVAHYLVLLFMISAVGVTVRALATWARRRRTLRRRGWWLLAILLGAFRISLDWTTGQVGIQALTVQLLSAGFTREGLVGPWTLAFSLPAGAVAFLILNHRGALAPAPLPKPETSSAPL